MLLAIDVGNTNAVFAVHNGDRILGEFRCSSDHTRTADEYFVWLKHLMDHAKISGQINEVIISSTVPRVVFNLRVLSDKYFNCRPMVIGKPEVDLGMIPRVDPDTRVGPDRLVNAVSGYDRYGGDLIIVDFGTATTFDVVDHDGAYIGGVISPGVNVSLEAFHHAAAALPHIDVTKPNAVVGTNTIACMQSGVYWGYIGLVEGICKRIATERNRAMKIIGTGGLSPLFAQGTDIFTHLDADLTVHGLVLIAALNRKNKNEQK
ncbi:MAG: type III pantothenate kinase [Rhodobacteraceae bacterium]|nr:type III pantothenate kinase [Paracoccaceae bacterium]